MNHEKIVDFFFEIATLRRLTRSHLQMIQGANDNISDHSFRVAVIGMMLAKMEKADENKILKMCLFHDVAESRTGDLNYINQHYAEKKEKQARKDQLAGLPIGDEIKEMLSEYETMNSKEATIAKDADLIDQMILQQEYFKQDDYNLQKWQDHTQKNIKTGSALVLAKKIRETNPFDWLYRFIKNT